MPRGQHRRQGPRNPIQAAANYVSVHPWQQVDQASPGVTYTPLVDPWIERPCCGDPVCVRMTMERESTVSGALGGSDPGTLDGSPWLLDHFLAQLGDYMSFRFEHYQDNLSPVCEILGRLTGRARAWAAPYLDGDLPLPDDYELFCQDLEEVFQDPNNFAEYHAAVPCPPAPSLKPVTSGPAAACALDSEHGPGRCSRAPCDEMACVAKEPHSPPGRTEWRYRMTLDIAHEVLPCPTAPLLGTRKN
ncbi:hypothetical protein HPG69_018445 [Diceros bicornis minor]|uniref:DUF4939 domain-containing protein n=1 Tax=Diceros bicornis minor TaxID=77932 RepID=A0A7J7EMJ9_DICBM|nr:hypothetical protein HPG69_018445 [Diceros bicornis minor]